IECAGCPKLPRFEGNGSTALDSAELTAKVTVGTVVAACCCYGAQLYDPAGAKHKLGICNTYLWKKAYGYFGSSTIAYGADNGIGIGRADYLCGRFLEQILAGFSLGWAGREARELYLTAHAATLDPTLLDDRDKKTLAQFNLMGDPSLQPIQPSVPLLQEEVMTFTGKVVVKLFARGTKSQREAVMLATKDRD